jgi:hypothetical protein
MTLDAYLAPSFSCRLRSFTFSNFTLDNSVAAASNAIVTGVDPTLVTVLAYRPPIRPLPGFGFLFDGFSNSVVVGTTQAIDVDGQITTTLGFDFVSTRRELTRAGFYADLLVDQGSRPGQIDGASTVVGTVDGLGSTCLGAARSRTASGESMPSPISSCSPSDIVSGHATFSITSELARSRGRGAIDGSVTTTLQAIELHAHRVPVTTPEPATLALAAGGLLLLGAGARRRTR